MPRLSKSRIMASLQCLKRVHLEAMVGAVTALHFPKIRTLPSRYKYRPLDGEGLSIYGDDGG